MLINRSISLVPTNPQRVKSIIRPLQWSAKHAPQRSSLKQRICHIKSIVAHASSVEGDAGSPSYDLEDLDTAKSALDLGLGLCKEERWGEALAIFEKALTLPGTGLKRFRDKPRTISDGERMAALYNIACCHAKLNDPRTGLVALAGCLEAGYEDFRQCRTDPDLANLRADDRFEGLMQRFEPKKPEGFFGSLFGGFK